MSHLIFSNIITFMANTNVDIFMSQSCSNTEENKAEAENVEAVPARSDNGTIISALCVRI